MPDYMYGLHVIKEQLKAKRPRGKLLVAGKNSRIRQLIDLARQKQVPVIFTDEKELDNYCHSKSHKGVLLLLERIVEPGGGDFKTRILNIRRDKALVLLLDSVTDPHNYGAILRSADQFRADLVVTTEKRSARATETVAAVSAGASIHVNSAVATNLVHVIDFLKKEGYWVYGADAAGKDLHTVDLKGRVALVMGSEGSGIRRLVKKKCDLLLRIPTHGHVDSLNVSVAAGILMYEVKRQQDFS